MSFQPANPVGTWATALVTVWGYEVAWQWSWRSWLSGSRRSWPAQPRQRSSPTSTGEPTRPSSSTAAPASGPATTEDALARLREFYAEEPFVVITDASPSTKATLGSNTVHITARVDDRTGWLVVISALDNLVKGAAGQMIQCANVLLDLPETRGLPVAGVYP